MLSKLGKLQGVIKDGIRKVLQMEEMTNNEPTPKYGLKIKIQVRV